MKNMGDVVIQNLIDSMSNRINEVIKNKGKFIDYQNTIRLYNILLYILCYVSSFFTFTLKIKKILLNIRT